MALSSHLLQAALMPDPCLPRHAHRSPVSGNQYVGYFATYDLQMILHLQKSVTAADRSVADLARAPSQLRCILNTAAQATYRSENQADVGGGSRCCCSCGQAKLLSVKMVIRTPFLLSFDYRFRQQDFMICKQRSKLLMCSVWLAVIPVSER